MSSRQEQPVIATDNYSIRTIIILLTKYRRGHSRWFHIKSLPEISVHFPVANAELLRNAIQ